MLSGIGFLPCRPLGRPACDAVNIFVIAWGVADPCHGAAEQETQYRGMARHQAERAQPLAAVDRFTGAVVVFQQLEVAVAGAQALPLAERQLLRRFPQVTVIDLVGVLEIVALAGGMRPLP